METTVNLFEGPACYDRISTSLNVSPDFIEMKLAKQYEYRPTLVELWATVTQGSIEVARYKFVYGQGLTEINF